MRTTWDLLKFLAENYPRLLVAVWSPLMDHSYDLASTTPLMPKE